MRERPVVRARALAMLAASVMLAATAGCSPAGGPPAIHAGSPCASCGMAIQDRHFACARGEGRRARRYDAIECLLRDSAATGRTWLADYDRSTLHAAESLWVVHGRITSPMGGGFAAFADRAAAEAVAAERSGRVGRLEQFAAGGQP